MNQCLTRGDRGISVSDCWGVVCLALACGRVAGVFQCLTRGDSV